MKIAMVLEKWGLDGGSDLHNLSMLKGFTERGYGCFVIYGDEGQKSVDDHEPQDLIRHNIPSLSAYKHVDDNLYLSQFLAYMEQESPDAVYLGHVKNMAILEKIKENWPTIVMVQDHWLTCLRVCKTSFLLRKPCRLRAGLGCILHACFVGKSNKPGAIARYNSLHRLLSIQRLYRNFECFVVASRFVQNQLIYNGFEGRKIHVLGYFNEITPQKTTEVPREGNVLFVGRVDRYKGVDLLLKAAAKSNTKPKLIIAGDGPYLPKAKKLARKLNIQNQVDFVGWVDHEGLSRYYDNATVVAVPSVWGEPFGKVGIEAMAHARPVLAFNVGGIPEWLEHEVTGYLIPYKNIEALAQGIDKIYERIEISRQMGRNARTLALQNFSKETYLNNFCTLFAELR